MSIIDPLQKEQAYYKCDKICYNRFMKIYIAHSSDIDYKNKIYKPLKDSVLSSKHTLILPHDGDVSFQDVRDKYRDIDIVIAECSKPSTGMGIELGWFFDDDKPIFCFYKSGTRPSSALEAIAKEIIEYDDSEDFIKKLDALISNNRGRVA